MFTVGSLFSGIGGFELGLEMTGHFKTIWQVEIDDYARKILEKHWPGVPKYNDIREIDWSEVERPDILCGGFPCQDISIAGRGAGISGERSSLWKEYTKAIRILRPKIALIENVPMLAKRGLVVVLADLAEAGYDAEWFTLSAAEVGAPHLRERTFVVAYTSCPRTRMEKYRSGRQESKSPGALESEILRQENRSSCPEGNNTGSIDVSHHNSQWQLQQKGSIKEIGKWTCDGGKNVPDTIGNGCEEVPFRQPHKIYSGRFTEDIQEEQKKDLADTESQSERYGHHGNAEALGHTEKKKHSWIKIRSEKFWETEPDVGRVANGIPSRVDRIRCLGNAVVPQVAQVVGEMILEVLRDKQNKKMCSKIPPKKMGTGFRNKRTMFKNQ